MNKSTIDLIKDMYNRAINWLRVNYIRNAVIITIIILIALFINDNVYQEHIEKSKYEIWEGYVFMNISYIKKCLRVDIISTDYVTTITFSTNVTKIISGIYEIDDSYRIPERFLPKYSSVWSAVEQRKINDNLFNQYIDIFCGYIIFERDEINPEDSHFDFQIYESVQWNNDIYMEFTYSNNRL